MDHDLEFTAGYRKVEYKQKYRAGSQKEGKQDPQHIDRSSPFTADQRNVGNAESRREKQKEGSRKHDIGFCGG